jgi:hypothetical protein
MARAMRLVAATCTYMIALALSGPVIGGDYRGSELPRTGGHVEDWYFGISSKQSDFASFETESIPSDLPRSGGHVEDRYSPAYGSTR